MPTSFGNYTPDEYNDVVSERDDALARSRDSSRLVTELQARLGRATTISDAATEVEKKLAEMEQSGEIMFGAKDIAVSAAVDGLAAIKNKAIADTLLAEHGDAYRREINSPEWVEARRSEYDAMFEQDGTYARLKEDIQHQSDKEIAAEVQDNFAKQVEAELNDPTKRTANIQAAKDAFLNSDLANQVRTELEESAHDEWTEEGKRLGIRQIEEDIAQGKDEFVADIAQKFPDTREGKRVTKEARNRAEAEWTEENMPVIAAELGEKEFANYCLGKIAEKKTAEAMSPSPYNQQLVYSRIGIIY